MIEGRTRWVDEHRWVKTGRKVEILEKRCPECLTWGPDNEHANYCGQCAYEFPMPRNTPNRRTEPQ
jgi:hypothetical protein